MAYTSPPTGRMRYLRRSLPHILLVVIYVAYLIAGGLIFHAIEGATQHNLTDNLTELDDKPQDELTAHDIQLEIGGILDQSSDDEKDRHRLQMVFGSLIASEDRQWSAERIVIINSGNEWTVSTSILFCMTTITTIGYGTITPATAWGKFMVVLYSSIGVPLSFIFIADMGGLLAQLAVLVASIIRRRCCNIKKKSNKFERFENEEERTGRNRPIYLGLHHMSSDEEEEETKNGDGETLGDQPNPSRSTDGDRSPSRIVMSREEPSYLASFAEPVPNAKDAMPLLVVLCLLLLYLCLGGLIFSISEEWSFLDAFYFTFVTMATIGYGDLFPIEHVENNSMVPVTVFTLFGLCWLSMCVWLVAGRAQRLVRAIRDTLSPPEDKAV